MLLNLKAFAYFVKGFLPNHFSMYPLFDFNPSISCPKDWKYAKQREIGEGILF